MEDIIYYGPPGSGKSVTITQNICNDLRAGYEVILLVPEQESVHAEQRLSAATMDVPTVGLEILSFRRLTQLVLRSYGGVDRRVLHTGGRRVVMSRALQSVAPALTSYQQLDVTDAGTLDGFLQAMDDFRQNNVNVLRLEQAAKNIAAMGEEYETQNIHSLYATDAHLHRLSDKINDLALIFASYNALCQGKFYDPNDDLTYLAACMEESGFFVNKHIYFDGFYGFMPLQLAVVEQMARQAGQMTFAFLDAGKDGAREWMMQRVDRTGKQIEALLERAGRTFHVVRFQEDRRIRPQSLTQFSAWVPDARPIRADTPKICHSHEIRLVQGSNIWEEAEWLCCDILRRVQTTDCRFREINIVTRNTDRYAGVLDAAFEKYQIPYHFSVRQSLMQHSLFRFIDALMRCHTYHCRRQDVLTLIKTGFLPISIEDACLFERYVELWNIQGEGYLNNEDWQMHPDGLVKDRQDDSEDARLQAINRARRVVAEHLQKLFDAFDNLNGAADASAYLRVLITFLCSLHVPEQLQEKAKFYEQMGDRRGRDVTLQLWQTFCDVTDELVLTAEGMQIKPESFFRLLTLMVADADIGTIPAGLDCVTFSDAALLRADHCRHIYLIGMTDGAFPQTPPDNRFFSEWEKEVFAKQCHIESFADKDQMAADEMFYIRQALCAPTQSVTLSTFVFDPSGKAQRPSAPFLRAQVLCEAYSDHPMLIGGMDIHDLIWNAATAAEHYAMYAQQPLGKAMMRFFRDHPHPSFDTVLYTQSGARLSEPNHRVSAACMSSILGDNMRLSPSALEKYVKCPFAYFCNDILHLAQEKKKLFESNDAGTYMHDVLEQFVRAYAKIPRDAHTPDEYDDARIAQCLDEYTNRYILSRSGGNINAVVTPRLMAKLGFWRPTAFLLIKKIIAEFSQSAFYPQAFELRLSDTLAQHGGDAVKELHLTLPDRTNLALRGVADRVDVWHRGENSYLRVIDYKTGSKTFDMEKVKDGLDMQMLIYLFALRQNGADRFGGKIIPAGVLYQSAGLLSLKENEADLYDNEIETVFKNKFPYSGVVLNDDACILAMDQEKNGVFLPKKVINTSIDSEEMKKTEEQILQKSMDIAMQIRQGCADVRPYIENGKKESEACKYCEYKPICRRADSILTDQNLFESGEGGEDE